MESETQGTSKEKTDVYHRIVSLLEQHHVQYETFEHDFVHHSEDAAKMRGTKLDEAAKALVFKAGSGALFMCVVSGHRKIDIKAMKTLLGEKNIGLAHPDEVLAATGCPIGSVPPFGTLFSLPTYCDDDVFLREHVVFSAGSHYHSIRLGSQDWKSVVKPIVAAIGKENKERE